MSISSSLLNFYDLMDVEANSLAHKYCNSGGTSFDRLNNSIEFILPFLFTHNYMTKNIHIDLNNTIMRMKGGFPVLLKKKKIDWHP